MAPTEGDSARGEEPQHTHPNMPLPQRLRERPNNLLCLLAMLELGVVFVLRTELCGRIWGWASVIVLVGTCFIPKWTLSEKQQQKDFFLWALAF